MEAIQTTVSSTFASIRETAIAQMTLNRRLPIWPIAATHRNRGGYTP